MTLNRKVIDINAYHKSEQAFNHAERQGIVLDTRKHVKAVIRCNQMLWDGKLCEWSETIEARAIDIEGRIKAMLVRHLRRAHPQLDAVATADRRWLTLRDIGG